MSYSLVEVETASLVKAFALLANHRPDDQSVSDLGFQLESFLSAVQSGLENHIDECRGVVDALRDARTSLEEIS